MTEIWIILIWDYTAFLIVHVTRFRRCCRCCRAIMIDIRWKRSYMLHQWRSGANYRSENILRGNRIIIIIIIIILVYADDSITYNVGWQRGCAELPAFRISRKLLNNTCLYRRLQCSLHARRRGVYYIFRDGYAV